MEPAELRECVAAYLEHCRTNDERLEARAMAVLDMTFTAPPEDQWRMVLEAVRQARDDEDLGHVAAGPLEGLLGRHGKACIHWVEREAALDPKFARAMIGVWKYTMPDDVWDRVRSLQDGVPGRLPSRERDKRNP